LLHAIVSAAGGYTLVYTKIPAQVLFDRREEARKRRKAKAR
jgi:hypothetical protein